MFDNPPRVLIADDQPDILVALRFLLKGEGCYAKTVSSPLEAVSAISAESFDLALIDLNYARDTTSGQEGMDLIRRLKNLEPNLPIVVMTAWATVDLAVECMRRGAADFIQKPWDNARVIAIIKNQTDLFRARNRRDVLEDETRVLRGPKMTDFLAESDAMKRILDVVERVAESDANILVTGENGSGKGVIARLIHDRSNRADKPFIAVNMGGIAAGVAESELFGHVKGAFTDAKADRAGRFEMADGGTLFMDEIANVPTDQQNKLLRVIETGDFERVGSSKTRRVNVRLISATNADLDKEVATSRFRQDLLFRINTIHLHLPPLRERVEDIPLLARHFLKVHSAKYKKTLGGFAKDALTALRAHRWPGNVRELEHCIERAVLFTRGPEIVATDLGLRATEPAAAEPPADGQLPSVLDNMSFEDLEKYLIQRTLKRHDNVSAAAEALGVSRSAFYRRLQKYGL
ncbi:MAG: sigma-54 dependent transcriptional regulator [Verrucomicrobiota bacterium]|nr:sigma-54 dependent transcriptional regulator [Verrucomicrobiota bacterium]